MLKSFAPKDRAEFKDDKVVVTCEFCSLVYQFTPHELGVERRGQSGVRPPSVREIAAEWWARCALPTYNSRPFHLSGKSPESCPAPFAKIFRLTCRPNQPHNSARLTADEGRWPSSRTCGEMRWTQMAR
jgi:hypothetical protein